MGGKSEVSVLDGSSFFISDGTGDAVGAATHGFFYRDTRFLSVAALTVNGQRPVLLSNRTVDYFSAMFFLTLPYTSVEATHALTIIRNRFVGQGVHEDVLLVNYGDRPLDLTVTLTFDCDFADLFEIKGGLPPLGQTTLRLDTTAGRLVFDYQVQQIRRQTTISFSERPHLEGHAATFNVQLPVGGHWQTCVWVTPVWDQVAVKPKYGCDSFGKASPETARSLPEWQGLMPVLRSGADTLTRTYAQSVVDLAALRFYPGKPDHPVLAAGLPWFMALFGRDNLITAYQCCYAVPGLAVSALRELARLQGTRVDDFRDEAPGKILHELRFGELTVLGESPHSPYFGSVDATPLFLILLHEAFQWTGDRDLVSEMHVPAMRALAWIDGDGDPDGDGYVEYCTRSPKGLANQGWKDSPHGVLFHDGRRPEAPIALAEVQGYVYDAKLRMAELAEQVWDDPELAGRLRTQAALLKERFNRDFWIAGRGGYFALALDKDKRQVDSKTSNMGHLLWSGIAEPDKAAAVVAQLLAEPLNAGWGIRTLSFEDAGFNPIDYHNGTVWPHDNSLIAAGLARYGYRKEAARIITDLLDAAPSYGYRLPELFAGYARAKIPFPVDYPTASCPQAWATGTPLLFVRTLLGLAPDREQQAVRLAPHLPESITYIRLENLRLFGRTLTVDTREGS